MAVEFDPHQNIAGNLIRDLAVAVIGTKYRMLVPSNGPFYSHSLVVKSGSTVLKLGGDYLITHPYMTGTLRTGRSVHGMIWIVNPKYTSSFTITAHYVGKGEATTAQINAERAANANKFPSDCQWEDVIGDVYFPPVDIQFDWDNWKGERELMQAIVEIGKKITELPPIPDPMANNTAVRVANDFIEPRFTYDNSAGFITNQVNSDQYAILSSSNYALSDFKFQATYNLPSYVSASTAPYWWMTIIGYWGSPFRNATLELLNGDTFRFLITYDSFDKQESFVWATKTVDANFFKKPFTVTIDRKRSARTVELTITQDGVIVLHSLMDMNNPPAAFAARFIQLGIAVTLDRGTDFRFRHISSVGDSIKFSALPGATIEIPDGSDVLTLLKKYHSLVDKLYRESPAHAHILRKDNPHGDQSYGRMRAIELNGIADDATLAYGKSQAQLADYVNQRSAKATDFSDKMLRKSATPRTITGTFTMLPGLSSITSAKDTEASGVGTNLQVDDKVVRLIARDSSTISAGSQPITFNAGANVMVLYPDARELQWNGKKILDPTTVAPYLPGNEGGGSGIFYATPTATMTVSGSGIQSMPFIFTWVAPDDTDNAALALRMLTTEFGNSESLAATPALIQKLANEFTGKLEQAKAYINGLSLMSSVSLDKTSFNLDAVENIADLSLPTSSLQRQEMAKYAKNGHTHDASAFGIGDATTAKAGLVQFGGLVNDATLALEGQYVATQYDTVEKLEATVGNSDTEAIIDILRFGASGNNEVMNGGSFNGWMVVLNPNNYFVKKDYAVPTATFNLSELFPVNHEDTVIGVYVDIVGDTAQYVLKDSINFAETDTLTRIGEIYTDETQISGLSIRNTTRLGNFRELEEHAADVSAHIPRAMTQAQFGYTFTNDGPTWNNGVPGTRRFDGDWRMLKGPDYVPMENVDWPSSTSLLLKKTGTGVANHRHLVHQCPIKKSGNIVAAFSSSDVTASNVFEVVLASWKDSKERRNRISLLIQRTNNITGSEGTLCYLGFAINYGTNRQVLIGINASSFTTANDWQNMAASVTFNLDHNASGALQITGGVNVNPLGFTFSVDLVGKRVTFWRTYGAAAVTEAYDLAPYLTAAQVDISPLVSVPTWPVYHGIGGTLASDATVALTYDMGNFAPRPGYDTAFDYIHTLSEMNRIRVITAPSASKLSNADVRTAAAAKDMATAAKRPDGVPDYLNKDRLATYSDGVNYTAVVVRD
ncbi:virion structural protein [Erwinia phage vB_EamM_ChrisDB]|uniref:virion structural protein n=1 Tax=Erwinia phage vB_EamM_ChrisDB TaxID=1883371 RepID=UPI00081C8195|nr:virion structural protein [Erwinia phage vB_EamM_ChrisDB]ANZ48754.1 putative virion structural protein [Erwinia phage vB_EamM_ChrisDB]